MKQKFSLKNAEQVRQTTTMQQQKKIRKLYADLYKEVSKQIRNMKSDDLQKQNLVLLQRDIKNRIHDLSNDIQNGIVDSMNTVSMAVVEDTRTFLQRCGFKNIHDAFQYVPDQIVRNIYSGNVYQNGWKFSDAIWKMELRNRNVIDTIVAKGTAQGKSAYQIAKDIEQYVNPSASKQSRKIDFQKYKRDVNGRIMYDKNGNPIVDSLAPRDTSYFGNVDYNAQRLARTLISHAYQQSFRNVNENDPFVTGYIWHSAGLHGRTCDICLSRDGKFFEKNELPEDHPNGMCTYEAYIPDSMSDIAKKIGLWYNSPTGTYPEIDKYAEDFIR